VKSLNDYWIASDGPCQRSLKKINIADSWKCFTKVKYELSVFALNGD
jgi:hypothetical protein